MPSGPKKRKAARKKKEKEHDDHSDPSSPSAHSHELDEGKHQDDRESDVGELSSPALSHQNLSSDGEEEEIEKEESSSTVPSVEALKIDDSKGANIVIEDENASEVKREFEIGESEKKDERIESDEPSKKSEDPKAFEHKVYSVAFTDAASERKDEEAAIRPIENIATVSDPKAFETQESGHRMTQSYNPAGAKDSAVSEALLAPASRPDNTSWKSCCGLFEVFARSDR